MLLDVLHSMFVKQFPHPELTEGEVLYQYTYARAAVLKHIRAVHLQMHCGLENKCPGESYYAQDSGIWEDDIEIGTGNRQEGTGLQVSRWKRAVSIVGEGKGK